MAKQHGPVKIQGTIGDITFTHNRDGSYGAKAKSVISKQRIANDPSFERTRENGREFGAAGKAGKVLRGAFQTMLKGADDKMTSRLHKQMMNCLKADPVSARGDRKVSTGDPLLLNGFDFNVHGKLATTLLAPLTTTVTRTTGVLDILVPSFVPTISLSSPQGATHYKLVAAGAEVDFAGEKYTSATANSTFLPIDTTATTPLTLNVSVTPNTTHPIYQVLSVHFFQEMNGVQYPLNSGQFDPIKIVNADV